MDARSSLLSPSTPDVQAGRPQTEVSLTRVGVTGVEKVIRVDGGAPEEGQLFFAQMECFVDLNPQQAGVHMSRFEEIVNEAIDEVVLSESLKAEELAASIAKLVRERQGGLRAEVALAARYPETVPTPATGNPTQEIYTLYGTAVASERGIRTLTGVEAQGMTACPCAQELVAAGARERLTERGYDPEQIEEILDAVPVATHNQRGIGTLHLGCPEGRTTEIDARDLLRIVESSMSSEIYELMKRSDERAVVEKALRKRGRRPQAMDLELGSTSAIRRAVALGLGLGFLSRWSIDDALDAGRVRVAPLPDLAIERRFSWASASGELSGTAARFRAFAQRERPALGH